MADRLYALKTCPDICVTAFALAHGQTVGKRRSPPDNPMRHPSLPPLHSPFAPGAPVRSLQDVERIEARPLAEALPVQSTYEIFVNSAAAFGDKTALTFLPSADPAQEPIRWSYAQLLTGIHQTANLLHHLGVGPQDAVAVLLPGCLEYHLALWGGEAAGIVQPLNPMLTEEKIAAMMTLARAKVLIAYGGEGDLGYWSKALRLRALVPSLTTVLRVAPHDEATGTTPALPPGVLDLAARHQHPGDHLVSGRRIAASDIAAYFHTGGTTGAPKLARHSHGAQVFTAWGSVQMQGIRPEDVGINGYPLFHVAGVLPGSLAALSAGVETIIPTTGLFRNREVIANYWRLVERYRCTYLSAVPTVLAALANVPLDGADIATLRYCRTGAAILAPELAARFERLFGLHIHESLGMTEMAGISTITPPGVNAPAGCVGWRLPYTQLRVVALDTQGNASDQDLPPGQPGMVLFQSPNLFSGFLDAADTAKAELLAFTAERVDEAVARPRWVQVLQTMPVTNVGKIYKPDLRQRAACHTVQALVDGVCGQATDGLRPQVQPEGDNAVRVTVAPGPDTDALQARLREVLAPLPLTVHVTTGPAPGSPQTA
eukprot:gene323-327_t